MVGVLRRLFATHALLDVVVPGNGAQFAPPELKSFLNANPIHLVTLAPFYPAMDVQAERMVADDEGSLVSNHLQKLAKETGRFPATAAQNPTHDHRSFTGRTVDGPFDCEFVNCAAPAAPRQSSSLVFPADSTLRAHPTDVPAKRSCLHLQLKSGYVMDCCSYLESRRASVI